MAKGVGRPYRVIDANSAHHGTPDDELHSVYVRVVVEGAPGLATQVKQQRIGEVDRIGIALQQQELPAAGEVGHEMTANAYNAGRKQPAHMAPEETPVRRMSVLIAIRISVMVSVVPDPPQWPILAGEHAEQREQELKRAARLERTVGEQPMISCGNPEQLDRARDYRRISSAARPPTRTRPQPRCSRINGE